MTVVEIRTCKQTGKEFSVMQHELDVLEQISPVVWWKKYLIPAPEYHPDLSHQWHLAWRNERTLYRSTCALTNTSIITCINPKQGYTIYNVHDWWSDAIDPFSYGISVDATKTFTEQYRAFFSSFPQMSLQISPHMENCDYCNYWYYAKDCYMCTTPAFSEKCYYAYLPYKCYYDVDGYVNSDCQYTYGCVYAIWCYTSQYVYYSTKCRYSSFLLDCRDCEYCFGCVNMSHKKYCFFNEQYDKQTYLDRVEEYTAIHSPDAIQKHFQQHAWAFPKRATRGHGNESSSGNLNYNMSNAHHSFDMRDAKNMTYCWLWGVQSADFVRCTLTGLWSRLYECIGMAEWDSCARCIWSNACYQVFYSFYCRDCEHCFGCIRLQHKKYCIFNVQYTKEEYEILVAEIIQRMQQTGERWRFFHPNISPFPYNDTCAQERFPETKEQILAQERWWIDHEHTMHADTWYTPENITYYTSKDHDQEILSWVLVCTATWRPYRIIEQELDFYKKFALPIPTKHHEERYQQRFTQRVLPRTLYTRSCMKTWREILTPYAPERPEIVWSEEVWDQEFLG